MGYVTSFLVNDCFAVMKQIVNTLSLYGEVRSDIEKDMEIARAYLKYGFDWKTRDSTSNCVLHSCVHGLDGSVSSIEQSTISYCAGCSRMFGFFRRMHVLLHENDASASTTQVVSDCYDKAELFLGHRLRVVNQQRAISAIITELAQRCVDNGSSSEALVVLDFKMKLEPLYYREKTVERYGKRGISWHGAMVQCFTVSEP